MNKKITVIVPVYNVESYLHECIDSILNQTFSEFELILIDDGSSDGSSELCDEYAKTDPRIRVLHQPNMGQSAARNNGVAEAKTDLVCFIDSDDMVNPTLLEHFINAYRKYDVGAVVSDRISGITPPEDFFQPKQANMELIEINETKLLELLQTNDTLYWTLFPCLLKKSIYKAYPLTPGRVMEDNAITPQWLSAAGKIAVLRAPLYFYRQNPTSTMNAALSKKKLDFLWALDQQLAFCKTNGYIALQSAALKEYGASALYLAKQFETKNRDRRTAKRIIKNAVRLQKKYKNIVSLTEEEQRKLFKAAHPALHRIRKHFSI